VFISLIVCVRDLPVKVAENFAAIRGQESGSGLGVNI
jgi:hypothetical protein